jgi:hypothetical protein
MLTLNDASVIANSISAFSDEKIGISKIKIQIVDAKITAIFQSFFLAEKFIHDFHSKNKLYNLYEFEILFVDGYVLSGRYEIENKSRPKSITTHVHSVCQNLQLSELNFSTSRINKRNFLDQYDIDS